MKQQKKPYVSVYVDSQETISFRHPGGGEARSYTNHRFPKSSTWLKIGYLNVQESDALYKMSEPEITRWWKRCLSYYLDAEQATQAKKNNATNKKTQLING